jgi:hypothetical protein
MSTRSLRRVLTALAAGGALIVASFAAASPANASTLYACVKKSGSAHVFAKKPKCKKGESKLSWNTSGPAGKGGESGKNGSNGGNGGNGTNGKDGKDGAVAGYSAVQSSNLDITNAESFTQVPGLTKSLPVGSFIAAGRIGISASGEKEKEQANATCEMVNTPTSGSPLVQEGHFQSWTNNTLVVIIVIHITSGGIPFEMAINNAVPSTLSVKCDENGRGEKVTMLAEGGSFAAVQVSSLS